MLLSLAKLKQVGNFLATFKRDEKAWGWIQLTPNYCQMDDSEVLDVFKMSTMMNVTLWYLYRFVFTAIAKPVSAGSQPKMTLPQLHARNSFDATSAALIKAVESDTFKNKGEYEAVTEVKSSYIFISVWIIWTNWVILLLIAKNQMDEIILLRLLYGSSID